MAWRLGRRRQRGDGRLQVGAPRLDRDPGTHRLVPHAHAPVLSDSPRAFDGLRTFLAGQDIEGLVFHHPDGRMGKIKSRDFGLKRPKTA